VAKSIARVVRVVHLLLRTSNFLQLTCPWTSEKIWSQSVKKVKKNTFYFRKSCSRLLSWKRQEASNYRFYHWVQSKRHRPLSNDGSGLIRISNCRTIRETFLQQVNYRRKKDGVSPVQEVTVNTKNKIILFLSKTILTCCAYVSKFQQVSNPYLSYCYPQRLAGTRDGGWPLARSCWVWDRSQWPSPTSQPAFTTTANEAFPSRVPQVGCFVTAIWLTSLCLLYQRHLCDVCHAQFFLLSYCINYMPQKS